MTGIELIAQERQRQIEQEGFVNDSGWSGEQLACAAAMYALPSVARSVSIGNKFHDLRLGLGNLLWPWGQEWWKPGDRIRELQKAGALIAAEIDRIQAERAALDAKTTSDKGD